MARLKVKYTEEVAPALFKKFGYKSTMQIPKIDKVVVNVKCLLCMLCLIACIACASCRSNAQHTGHDFTPKNRLLLFQN